MARISYNYYFLLMLTFYILAFKLPNYKYKESINKMSKVL